MLNAIKRLFEGSESEAPDEEDARLAAGALLVEAALADGIYADIESDVIKTVLRDIFQLSEEACAALLERAETAAEHAVDHHRFTKVAKTLPLPEREKLVESLWRIVFADDEECPFEDAFVRKVAPLLGVDDRASRLARQRVAREAETR
ncbi:MAG: TerB family tellurite resistance protein [Caulobacterales bacterium]|nr:TerB family tellurite resistance protein [Caulobacterales bacterium]